MMDDLIDDFLDACRRSSQAKGERKKSVLRLATRKATELRTKRDRLVERMTNGDRFLQENPGRPDYAELEDKWIAWLGQYEKIEDALAEGFALGAQ